MKKRIYHGWVVVEEASPGYNPKVKVEYNSTADGKRRSKDMGYGNGGCVDAIEWWDEHLKQPVKLEPTIRGCYRVYTEEDKLKEDRMPASKEDQLQRFEDAENHIKRAVYHLALSKVHKEKQDWRIFAQSAINILENAMKFKDPEEVV